MKNDLIKIVLFLFTIFAAFLSWLSLSQAITVIGASVWLVPMLWFSLLYILLSLEFVLVDEKNWTKISIILSFFSSLFFVSSLRHFLALLFAGLLMLVAMRQIHKDLGENVSISMIKTLRMGRTFFVLALALGISSQFYFQAQTAGLTKIPTFDVNELLSNGRIKKTIFELSPDLKKLENKNLTVDEYILENYKENMPDSVDKQVLTYVQGSQKISPVALQKFQDLKNQKILEAGREQLGKMSGQKLTGSEKVADVFSAIINTKINSFFNANIASDNSLSLPIVMAAVFFLTILSLSAFAIKFLACIVSFIFWFLIRIKLVKIKMVPVEMETIE